MTFLVVNNGDTKVDIILKGCAEPYVELPIDFLRSSLQIGTYLLLGATSKLFLLDMAQDFTIMSQITLTRHIFSIVAMN